MAPIEWAFAQDLPTAEKLVLVHLAAHANTAGLGRMDRERLERETGYKKRSIQRLLKSLKDSKHYRLTGAWYVIGDAVKDRAPALPADSLGVELSVPPVAPASDLAEEVASEVGDYVIDQLANFEARIMKQLASVPRETTPPEPEPPPDPVLESPLYAELLELNIDPERAYKLAQADLEMDNDSLLDGIMDVVEHEGATDYEPTITGRFTRILDILHGADAKVHETPAVSAAWAKLEKEENVHTVSGETDAFLLLYPAIVDAAKANVGRLSIEQFLTQSPAPWEVELGAIDKNSQQLQVEINEMLAELAAVGDPRCEVQPRTQETGDDGVVRTETLLGYHRRVTGKYNDMKRLQAMGVI